MAHVMKTETTFATTPRAWLPVGSKINEAVNSWSGRTDMATTILVGEATKTIPAPAVHLWWSAEIIINGDMAFGEGIDPSFLPDLSVRSNQIDYPVAMGAVMHESAHARFTKYNRHSLQEAATPFELVIVKAFEETRIENHILKVLPKNAPFLRAMALKIILSDLEEETIGLNGIEVFSHLVLLTLARVTAGSLKKRDVKPITDVFETMFDRKTQRKLRSIWTKAQNHSTHTEWDALLDYAKEWIETLRETGGMKSEEEQEQFDKELLEALKALLGEDFEPGEGAGEGEGEGSTGSGSGGLLQAMAESAEVNAQSEANSMAIQEMIEEQAEAREKAAAESKEASDAAGEVFGRGTGPAGFTTNSRLMQERMPTSAERSAAVVLSKQLERAKYRDRQVVRSTSVIPPGRLNARQMISGAEQRSRGAEVTAEPFAQKRRKHTDEPTLTIGTMVDISGSMSAAMEPMASMAWIMSEATRRVQGKCAMVYYGNDVFPVLKAGQHLEKVKVYDAPDGTERFDKAFKAMDGSLNLLNGDGARLLVIVSDLYYTHSEQKAAKKWVKRCRDAGVAVIVIPFGYDSTAKYALKGINGVEVIPDSKSNSGLTAAATEVGMAAVRQLLSVSSRR